MLMIPTLPVIEIQGGEVTVEASYLAARLGLSVNGLREEMRRRLVYSVVERGMDEDAGRLRLTFRYRARTSTVVIQRDGTLLSEEPRPRNKVDR
jgi:predicted ArsR family transcriptional regulator